MRVIGCTVGSCLQCEITGITYTKGCWEAGVQSPLCVLWVQVNLSSHSGCSLELHSLTWIQPCQESRLWACVWWAKYVACTNGSFAFGLDTEAAGHKVPQFLSSEKGKGNQGKQTKPWLLVYFLSGGTHLANEKLCGMTEQWTSSQHFLWAIFPGLLLLFKLQFKPHVYSLLLSGSTEVERKAERERGEGVGEKEREGVRRERVWGLN